MGNVSDYLPDGYVPYIGLIRILPSDVLQQVIGKAIYKAAGTLSHSAGKEIQGAVEKAVSQMDVAQAKIYNRIRLAEQGDERCGNDLARLLIWLEQHMPKPGPQPGPWYDLATIGLIGQLAMTVGGPLHDQLKIPLRNAVKSHTE